MLKLFLCLFWLPSILLSNNTAASNQLLFYCPHIDVFCTNSRQQLRIIYRTTSPGDNFKFNITATLENQSWSKQFALKENSAFTIKVDHSFCKNTYIYFRFDEPTNTQCQYIINELD